jgi:hypothetical protein
MKKLLSIPLAMLVLLSGMHFYIATHICKGEVTSTKWSFLAKTTGCGMEETSEACPIHNTISSKCCQTTINAYSTDNNFESSSVQLKDLSKNLLQIFNIPLQLAVQSLNLANIFIADFSPPNSELLSEVSLPDICVFRI